MRTQLNTRITSYAGVHEKNHHILHNFTHTHTHTLFHHYCKHCYMYYCLLRSLGGHPVAHSALSLLGLPAESSQY